MDELRIARIEAASAVVCAYAYHDSEPSAEGAKLLKSASRLLEQEFRAGTDEALCGIEDGE